jgi:predicted enzyme related to lactoylglutathione lyase
VPSYQEGEMIKKLGTVMLAVSDLDRSIEFYGDVLGLEVEKHSDHWAQADVGGTAIGFHIAEEVKAPGGESFALIFDVDDVDEVFRAVGERDVETVEEPHDQPYGRIATLRDPDGYVIQILKPSY